MNEDRTSVDDLHQSGSVGGSGTTARSPAGGPWQIRLRTLLLLLAAVAVWLAYRSNRGQIEFLESRIAALQPLARELIIDDESQIAVVKLAELWYDENEWQVYLPEGRYRLSLATRRIEERGLAPAASTAWLPAGTHHVVLEQRRREDAWQIVVTADGKPLCAVEEPKDWNSSHGSTGGGEYSLSRQEPCDQPVVLFRRRFHQADGRGGSTTPPGPTEGILLWIEPAGR